MRDEVVILFAAAGACALLILGVLELLWPLRPRGGRWVERRAGTSLARPRHLPQEPARDRLSVLAVVGQQEVAGEPRDRAPRIAHLR